MRFVFTSAIKDLIRLRRDPMTLLLWLGIPTFIAVILVVTFGRGEVKPHGLLLIADEDAGLGATLIAAAFSQGPLGNMISVEKVTRADGRRRIDKGDGSALLVIPKGFTKAFLNGTRSQLQLVRNPTQRILPEIIEEALSMLTDAGFYIQVVAGDQLRAAAASGTTDESIADISTGFRRTARSLGRYLNPPLIDLDTKVVQEKTDKPGGFAQLMLPGMLYLAVFFVAGGLASDVWRERTTGALRRVVTTPASFGAFLAGKLLAVLLVLGLVGAFGLVLAHFLVALPVSNFAVATVWIALSGVGLYLLMMLLQSLASNERVANMLSNFVMLPLTMLGGSFFPFDFMPQGFARIGRLTPNGWALGQLQNILTGTISPVSFGIVALFLAAAWLVVGWRIRRTPC